MIVRVASDVNVHDAGYAARGNLHYRHRGCARPCILPDRDRYRHTLRQTETYRDRQTETDRLRQTDRDRQTETNRPRQTYRDRPALTAQVAASRTNNQPVSLYLRGVVLIHVPISSVRAASPAKRCE